MVDHAYLATDGLKTSASEHKEIGAGKQNTRVSDIFRKIQ